VLLVGRASREPPVPARRTESQCFSYGERFAVEKFNAHRLDWLAGTLALPRPKFALGHFGSFFLFVLIPLVSSSEVDPDVRPPPGVS